MGSVTSSGSCLYWAPRETRPAQECTCHKPNRGRIATNTFTTYSASFEPAPSRRERIEDVVHVQADAKIASPFASFGRNFMHSMRHVFLSVVVVFALLFALLTVSPLAFARYYVGD